MGLSPRRPPQPWPRKPSRRSRPRPRAQHTFRYASAPVAKEAEWLDAEEAAKRLDFHVNTIYQMVRDGRLPALRFPVRIRRSDLDGLLERCRIKPGELAHLNAYARGEHLTSERSTTKAGRPDRRYGPRGRASR
jgi:excisionase family DNA binding protein